MPGFKLAKFQGKYPKVSAELLPDTAAQIAENCKLYSGDLIPYPNPSVIANTGRTGTIKTLYALRDPANQSNLKWLSWITDVDIAIASANLQDEQRFYYTGDGVPKVSNYDLATAGLGPYPSGAYDLGLPIPPDTPLLTTVAAPATSVGVSSFSRDASNIATLVTSAPHNLRTGNVISVSGFTNLYGTYSQTGTAITVTLNGHGLSVGAVITLFFSSGTAVSGTFTVTARTTNTFDILSTNSASTSGNVSLSIVSFNAISVECTRVNDTTITYFSPGFEISQQAAPVPINLASTYTVSGFSPAVATVTTPSPHGLVPGQRVSLTFTTGDLTSYSGSYTVVSTPLATTFTVEINISGLFLTGGNVTVDAGEEILVSLGGLTQNRTYVYTWFTPWEEESIASRPSSDLFIKEGNTVTVSNIPQVKPSGNNFVRGVRLYRTVPSTSGTEYYRLATLWFPTGLASVSRTGNVSRVTLLYPHNLDIDDRFKISGCTIASFDITGGVVTDVIDDYTFEYAQVAANVASTAVGAGTLYHDVSQSPPTTPAVYWGDGTYEFVDNFDSRLLLDILESDDYDAPPDDLRGLVNIQNNILAGFVGNTLYFSEPARPHAWPARYATPLPDDIVALAASAGSMLVLTKSYPYIVSTNDPASGVSVSRVDALYPCLNAKGVVTMGYGIVWPTNDGLAVYGPSSGGQIVTRAVYNNDTWTTEFDPHSIIAEYYGENYLASHSTGSFVFEQDTQIGGFFVDATPTFSASWYDTQSGKVYFVSGTNGDIYEWDDLSQPTLTMQWKSKVFVTKDMRNFGAARVIADYAGFTSTWDATTVAWESVLTNWNSGSPITFKFWVDKQLVFTTTVTDTSVFRLPTGYRSDTFEVGVEGNIRVRAIHMAETSLGLREV